MPQAPGGPLARRELHFIFLLDRSGSMQFNGKIQALNNAIRETVPQMRRVAKSNPHAQVLVRVVAFDNTATWLDKEPMPIERFTWTDLEATGGVTSLGAAVDLVAGALEDIGTVRGLPPVLLLLTDGHATDDVDAPMTRLLGTLWGKKAVRCAIMIGSEPDVDVLERFISNPAIKPLQANNPEQLLEYIRWASTVPLSWASSPGSGEIPVPTVSPAGAEASDIWQ